MKILAEGYVRSEKDGPYIDEMGRIIVRTDDTIMSIPEPGLHVFIIDADEIVDNLLKLGIKHPLSRRESKKLILQIAKTMRKSAEKRGDTKTLEQLEDPEAVVDGVMSESRSSIPKQTKVWTTSAKKKIRICDMRDDHLINAIRCVRQYAESQRLNHALFASTLNGDIAMGLAEDEQIRLDELHIDDLAIECTPIYENLLLDAERRGLKIED